MFVSFRKCSRPQKPDPISDHNCQNLYPFSDQNGSKTIPFGAAHTYIHYIGEYPPGSSFRLSSHGFGKEINYTKISFFSVDVQAVAQMRKVMKGKMKTKQISALLEKQISICQMSGIKQLTKILNSLLSHNLVCSTK